LVIWHIDQTVVDKYRYGNNVNTLPSVGGPLHPGVAVVEADGRYDMITPGSAVPFDYGECSDTWQVGQSWGATSTPNSNLWDGTSSGLSLRVLSENEGTLTLEINVDQPTQPQLNHKVYLPVISK
jgi:hypothetical protein